MDCQHQQVEASNIIVPSPVSIHVMVVDDDVTSLAIVSGLLKTLNYQVFSCNDPIRALCTLRTRKQYFDIIVTGLYMSKIDGFELTRRVNDEFKLPVIMFSTDDRESVMFRAMQEGVVLYLLKPFSSNDLRNIWQYVITTKPRSNPNPNFFIEETRSHGVEFRAVEARSDPYSNELVMLEKKTKDSKGRGRNRERANDKKGLTSTKKKAKVVWTDFLQYRFLQAVHYIGLEKAVPKKILEVMNVPGLTRENVASHLQKYRIFLRKVAERCMITTDKRSEEILWSKFLSRHASLVLEKIHRKRTLELNSSENPNNPNPPTHQNSNPNNGDLQSTRERSSYETNLLPYGPGNTTDFSNIVGPLPMNQNNNNAQAFNFSGSQFQNLPVFENSYQNPNFSSNDNNYYAGYSVGAGGEILMAPMDVSNGFDGNYVGFDGMGMGNFGGSEAIQTDEYGQYGIGFGVDNGYNWGLMCDNGVNFGGDSQMTERNSTHAHDNKDGGQQDSGIFASLFQMENFVDNPIPNQQQGNDAFMNDQNQNHHPNNMYTADEESPTADPFSIDDKVLDEFFASLLKTDNSAEG